MKIITSCSECKHGKTHGPGGSRRCGLIGELIYDNVPPAWCPLRGVTVAEETEETEESTS